MEKKRVNDTGWKKKDKDSESDGLRVRLLGGRSDVSDLMGSNHELDLLALERTLLLQISRVQRQLARLLDTTNLANPKTLP